GWRPGRAGGRPLAGSGGGCPQGTRSPAGPSRWALGRDHPGDGPAHLHPRRPQALGRMTDSPNHLQLDALREIANVGYGHAVTALSRLAGGSLIQLDVPGVLVTPVSDVSVMVGGADARVVAALLELRGELGGMLLLVLPEEDARRLCSALLKQPCDGPLS